LSAPDNIPRPAITAIYNDLAFYTNARLKYELNWFWEAETVPLLIRLHQDFNLLELEPGTDEEVALRRHFGSNYCLLDALVEGKGVGLNEIYASFAIGIWQALHRLFDQDKARHGLRRGSKAMNHKSASTKT